MKCRTLITTDTFAAGSLPHLLLTALDERVGLEVETVQDRDNKYKDVAGVLLYKDEVILHDFDREYMNILVSQLNKNLVYLVQGEYLIGWLFYNDGEKIVNRKIQAHSTNDINFDVWLESQNGLWNPIDFLLEGSPIYSAEMFQEEDDLQDTLDRLEAKLDELMNTINK